MAYTEKSLQMQSTAGKHSPSRLKSKSSSHPRAITNEPKRCPACRSTRRTERFGGMGAAVAMAIAVLARCILQLALNAANRLKYPFQPRGDKPVYCRDCYTKSK